MNRTIPLMALLTLNGCLYFKTPKGNAAFDQVTGVRQLAGVYQNVGEGADADSLAAILGLSRSSETVCVEVNTLDDDTVRVTAWPRTGIEKTFVRGKDFDFTNGRIRLKGGRETVVDPFGVVVSHASRSIGIDTKGNAKRSEASFAYGLVVFLPVVGAERIETRYPRLDGPAPIQERMVTHRLTGHIDEGVNRVETRLTLNRDCGDTDRRFELSEQRWRWIFKKAPVITRGRWEFHGSEHHPTIVLHVSDDRIRTFTFNGSRLYEEGGRLSLKAVSRAE